ncbi:MAG: hypothetical protein WAK76_18035 [Trebonia sp.]
MILVTYKSDVHPAWAALAMALAVAAAIPLARTVLAARRAG